MLYIESETVELKSIVTKDLTKEIIAFANTSGGKIYIGINDHGEVIGVSEVRTDIEKISNMLGDQIKPSIVNYINIYSKVIASKEIICIDVQRGDGKPYYLNSKGMRPSGVYRRLGNTSVPVSESDIRRMIIENHGLTYETTRSLEQSLTFLYTNEEFRIRNQKFSKPIMKTLGLIDEEGLFTNLALLLSDQCPHIIKAAVFADDDKTIFRHRQEFGGSLLKQLNDVYVFVEMQNNMVTTYEGLRRKDAYDYNLSALREGLVNAIVHRDYGVGGNIFVNIYPNLAEFVSLGSLPSGISYEDILEGVSKPRNEKLANIFYRLELIEAYGTGVRKILNAYKDEIRKPEFVVTPNAFIVRMPKFIHSQSNTVKESVAYYDTGNTLNPLDQEAVNEAIINQLNVDGSIRRKNIQLRYGFSQTKSGNILRDLESSGRIKKKGKGKNIYYVL